ncbi:hypothetical protein C8F04DRAFT_1143907 [Mycena alexandri]|uniref:Uncharacterized protein n=1 Tax=Mycena alexandri TaxID=1745969 RepID=A0AAD6S7C9_9AGAR|nr:hypothetical protein C8F04DRAFT_1143907 [Mycena alexandri]
MLFPLPPHRLCALSATLLVPTVHRTPHTSSSPSIPLCLLAPTNHPPRPHPVIVPTRTWTSDIRYMLYVPTTTPPTHDQRTLFSLSVYSLRY